MKWINQTKWGSISEEQLKEITKKKDDLIPGIFSLLGFVRCLLEKVKSEPSSILKSEEQAATLPDLIHFLPRKWRRRISAHTAISSLILFLLVFFPLPLLHLLPPPFSSLLSLPLLILFLSSRPSGQNSLWMWGLMDGLFSSTWVCIGRGGEDKWWGCSAFMWQRRVAVCQREESGFPAAWRDSTLERKERDIVLTPRCVAVMSVWGTVL